MKFNLNRNNLGEKPESNQSEQTLKSEPSTPSQPTDIKKAENEVANFLCGKSDTLMGSHDAQTSSVESAPSSTPSKQEEKGLLDEKIAPLTESDIKVEDVLYNGDASDIQLELSETAIENAPSTKDESNTPSVNEVFYTQDEQTYNQDVFNDTNHNDNSHTEDASNDGMALEDQQPIGQIKDVEIKNNTTNTQSAMTEETHQVSDVKVEDLNHPQTDDATKSDIMQTNHQNGEQEQEQEMPHVPNVSSSQEINHYLDKTKDNKLTAIDLEQLQVIVDKIKASNPQAQIEEFEALKKKDSKLDQEIYGHKVLAKQNEELLEKLLKQMKEISGKETVEEFAHYVQSVIENNEAEIQGYRQYITEKEAILTKINEDLAKL